MKTVTFCLFLSAILLISSYSQAQTITTKPLSVTSLCPGTAISVDYEITGTFDAINQFGVQISDPNGSFGTFKYLAYLKSTKSGTFQVTIPEDITPASKYRLRVIGTSPFINGSDNGSDIEIFSHPKYQPYLYGGEYGDGLLTLTNFEFDFGYNFDLYDLNSKFQCSWDFGENAQPRYFTGNKTPKVKYSTPGTKTISFNIPAINNCNWSASDSAHLFVVENSCLVKIDSTILIDSTTNYSTYDKSNYTIDSSHMHQIWIYPGKIVSGYFYAPPFTVIMEVGSSVSLGEIHKSVFYLKPGASLTSGRFTKCIIFISKGASINLDRKNPGDNIFIDCDSIEVDYKAAPQSGKDLMISLGYLSDVNDKTNITELKIDPNPANSTLNIRYSLAAANNIKLSLINQLGYELVLKNGFENDGQHVFQLPVMNELISSGVYFIKLQSGSDIKMEKVVIIR